jgi:hypothetical protein
MKRNLPILLGLTLGLAALGGCVPPAPAPALCPALTSPPPVPPPPVAVFIPPPTPRPVWTPPRRHVAMIVHHAHPVAHHYWVHRYVARTVYREVWTSGCGNVAHPCDVDHRTVPIQ